MNKVLLISHNQFGYQLSSYYFSYYLRNKFNISYVSFDEGKEKIQIKGVQVYYLKKDNESLIKSYLKFIWFIISFIRTKKPDSILIKYFTFCFIIPVISFRKIILDIRTASVSSSPIKNSVMNFILRVETLFFNILIILSGSLKDRLALPRAIVVPLGAEPKGFSTKTFDSLNLVYIGTLNNRNIEKTVVGLYLFRKMYPCIDINYTIIGDGKDNFKSNIEKHITRFNLDKYVTLEGYVLHTRIAKYLTNSNVGVSFVPLTKYYDKQPPTKTFEYLFAGMPILATNTFENRMVVNDQNGILIKDNPQSFAIGLRELWINKENWNSMNIADTISKYTWENIVKLKLFPLFEDE